MSGRPPFHCSDAAGFERPAVLPPCPSETSAWAYEQGFVLERRERGVGWSNLARMTGRTVHDLRRDYDASYI